MSLDAYVIGQGAVVRNNLAQVINANGRATGLVIAKRYLFEVADIISEMWSPRVALEALLATGDMVQLDGKPESAEEEQPRADLVVQALEGVVTLQEQTRQKVGLMVTAVDTLRRAVDRFERPPETVSARVWLVIERVSWWPLAFAAGVIFAGAVR